MPKSSPELMPARRMAAGGLAGCDICRDSSCAGKGTSGRSRWCNKHVRRGYFSSKWRHRCDEAGQQTKLSGKQISQLVDQVNPRQEDLELPQCLSSLILVEKHYHYLRVIQRRGTNPIMGKGSNPNIAVDRLPLGSIPDARFAREGGQMKPVKGMVGGGLAALGRFLGTSRKTRTSAPWSGSDSRESRHRPSVGRN